MTLYRRFPLLLAALFVVASARGGSDPYRSCDEDAARHAARAKELAAIFEADQADRKPPYPKDLAFRDRARRARVGEIFGEGCLVTAADYLAAAMVFQHGDRPDHYFQTFLFSLRGAALGDSKQKRNAALGIDRYLVHTGKRQLFASQAFKAGSDPCWCLEPIEPSFPEALRKEYMGTTLKEQLQWVDSLNHGTSCGPAKACAHDLAPSPKGTVPGLW